MLKTDLQFYVFLACVSFGGILGLFFSFKEILFYKVKNKNLQISIDICTFFFGGLVFSLYSLALSFPNFRAYMIAGVFLGLFIYNKTFRIMLAKILKKGYNKYINKRTKTNERKRI